MLFTHPTVYYNKTMSEPRGVIYVMTSAIDGLVKIGKTSTERLF